MPSPEKFMESLVKFGIGTDIIVKINSGYEDLVSKSTKARKREYFARAMELLDREAPLETLVQLMDYNACCRAKSSREKASKVFARENEGKTLAEKLALIPDVPFMGIPSLTDDGRLHILAIQYQHDERFHCTCPSINTRKAVETALSRSYCMCCAGHFKFHYEIMLGRALALDEVASSPLDTDGREPCAFIFRFADSTFGL